MNWIELPSGSSVHLLGTSIVLTTEVLTSLHFFPPFLSRRSSSPTRWTCTSSAWPRSVAVPVLTPVAVADPSAEAPWSAAALAPRPAADTHRPLSQAPTATGRRWERPSPPLLTGRVIANALMRTNKWSNIVSLKKSLFWILKVRSA